MPRPFDCRLTNSPCVREGCSPLHCDTAAERPRSIARPPRTRPATPEGFTLHNGDGGYPPGIISRTPVRVQLFNGTTSSNLAGNYMWEWHDHSSDTCAYQVMELSPNAVPVGDGWFPVTGLNRPVSLSQWVEVEYADGRTTRGLSENYSFVPYGSNAIRRYRLIEQPIPDGFTHLPADASTLPIPNTAIFSIIYANGTDRHGRLNPHSYSVGAGSERIVAYMITTPDRFVTLPGYTPVTTTTIPADVLTARAVSYTLSDGQGERSRKGFALKQVGWDKAAVLRDGGHCVTGYKITQPAADLPEGFSRSVGDIPPDVMNMYRNPTDVLSLELVLDNGHSTRTYVCKPSQIGGVDWTGNGGSEWVIGWRVKDRVQPAAPPPRANPVSQSLRDRAVRAEMGMIMGNFIRELLPESGGHNVTKAEFDRWLGEHRAISAMMESDQN